MNGKTRVFASDTSTRTDEDNIAIASCYCESYTDCLYALWPPTVVRHLARRLGHFADAGAGKRKTRQYTRASIWKANGGHRDEGGVEESYAGTSKVSIVKRGQGTVYVPVQLPVSCWPSDMSKHEAFKGSCLLPLCISMLNG